MHSAVLVWKGMEAADMLQWTPMNVLEDGRCHKIVPWAPVDIICSNNQDSSICLVGPTYRWFWTKYNLGSIKI